MTQEPEKHVLEEMANQGYLGRTAKTQTIMLPSEPVESWDELESASVSLLAIANTSDPDQIRKESMKMVLETYTNRILASQKQKIREEESDKMANAIEMSKQGWIEEGKQKQIEEIVSMLSGYIEHTNRCIRTYFEAGRPTKDGYEQKYRDKWYESSPVDKTPKCDCGLDDILTKLKESALNKK